FRNGGVLGGGGVRRGGGADDGIASLLGGRRGVVALLGAGGRELVERVLEPVGPGVAVQGVDEGGADLLEGGAHGVVVHGGDLRVQQLGGRVEVVRAPGGDLARGEADELEHVGGQDVRVREVGEGAG